MGNTRSLSPHLEYNCIAASPPNVGATSWDLKDCTFLLPQPPPFPESQVFKD